ncbi:sigma-E factor negative regulatory protein [Gilvimarinus polysaccharolyticus]|uniref:sigma-E factor negative regulatory protein n=1 Tax=Gilvimarinus polysaccharolyticus TaxID=863921 RepID=UPI0006732950|nr:RseA family anti-sigma factor [Gilvimarinus polysaccharolyticus]
MTEQSLDTQLAESLSALSDNEASELELARVLKAGSSDAVKAKWARYQIARSAMRGDLPASLAPSTFAERLSAELADEPSPILDTNISKAASNGAAAGLSRWWLGLGRVAVAASVTGAIVVGAQLYRAGGTVPDTNVLSADNSPKTISAPDNSLPIGYGAPALSAQQVSAEMGNYQPQRARQVVFEPRRADVKVSNEQIRAYLNQLVEEHTDHAAVNSAQGMLPYARVPLIEEE